MAAAEQQIPVLRIEQPAVMLVLAHDGASTVYEVLCPSQLAEQQGQTFYTYFLTGEVVCSGRVLRVDHEQYRVDVCLVKQGVTSAYPLVTAYWTPGMRPLTMLIDEYLDQLMGRDKKAGPLPKALTPPPLAKQPPLTQQLTPEEKRNLRNAAKRAKRAMDKQQQQQQQHKRGQKRKAEKEPEEQEEDDDDAEK
jgi:hypothetical protein